MELLLQFFIHLKQEKKKKNKDYILGTALFISTDIIIFNLFLYPEKKIIFVYPNS